MHNTWNYPHIWMQERLAQSMHQITLYARRKLHLAGLVAWEMRWKRCRHVCNSQNVCSSVNRKNTPLWHIKSFWGCSKPVVILWGFFTANSCIFENIIFFLEAFGCKNQRPSNIRIYKFALIQPEADSVY